jgi:hypothetical protein
MANQLGVAFQTCEELKHEKNALSRENDELRQEIDTLRAENESLRDQLEQDQSQHREETVQLRRQLDQAANTTQRDNADLHAELTRVRAEHDEHTQQLTRKELELRKARQEQAEYARLKSDHESLRSKLAEMKAKREEDIQRWSRQEKALRAQVGRRDETIRHFEDMTQERTNEAMRLDNENLREELAQLQAQQDEENEQWARKETELQRKIQQREEATRQTLDMTREVLGIREANNGDFDTTAPTMKSKGKGRASEGPLQRKPSYRREDTRTRIKNRVQQEVRNSRALSAANQSSHLGESPRKSYTGHSRFTNRSVSAPVPAHENAHADSDVESTTDLSLAPRATPQILRIVRSAKPTSTVQPPADLDLTELSYIDSNVIAQLRRTLEEERAAARLRAASAPTEQQVREDTVRSQRQTREDTVRAQRQAREDTVRSVASARSERRPSLVRKSSLKETTRTNVTQFEEDTGNMSNLDADAETTQTRQSAIDTSMLSNMGRRRRSAPTEMTSAFIVPDIKLDAQNQATTTMNTSQKPLSKDHDNANCTVCRREGYTTATEDYRVPKLVRVSSRTADDVDATLRPAQSPKQALALVVKGLNDERMHLHMELAVQRALLEHHDPSLGNRQRRELNASIQDLLRRIELKDTHIYNLYDVLEGQQADDLTEHDVEELTKEIRTEEQQAEPSQEKKAKKVTIRSFVDEDSIEVGRGGVSEADDLEDGVTQELPWEGFEDTGMEADVSFGGLEGWRTSVN